MLSDGLGHGVLAREASDRALATAEANPSAAPATILSACGTALQGSRGAVLAIVRLEEAEHALNAVSVGNIRAGVCLSGSVARVLSQAGIVGVSSSRVVPRSSRLAVPPNALLVLATDGTHDPLAECATPEIHTLPPWALAQRILERSGKSHDDAMVVVVR